MHEQLSSQWRPTLSSTDRRHQCSAAGERGRRRGGSAAAAAAGSLSAHSQHRSVSLCPPHPLHAADWSSDSVTDSEAGPSFATRSFPLASSSCCLHGGPLPAFCCVSCFSMPVSTVEPSASIPCSLPNIQETAPAGQPMCSWLPRALSPERSHHKLKQQMLFTPHNTRRTSSALCLVCLLSIAGVY
jgi:hypothetical protein